MKFAAILTCVAVLSACVHHVKPGPRTLVVGLSGRPTTLDPRSATDADSQRISDLLFAALVRNGPDLKPVPEAALSWKEEPRRLTFELRHDLHFHNGRPVTARDVVFSVGEYMKSTSPFASQLTSISSVDAAGPWTVIFHLKEYDAPLLSNLSQVKILAREDLEKEGDRFAQNPLGSGPFRFVSEDNDELKLQRFENAGYARPRVENLIFKFVRDDNTRYLKMIKGDLDVLLNELPEEKVAALRKTGKVNVLITPGLNFNYLILNLKNEKFKNPRFRRALFASLDRDSIVKYKLENMATPAPTIIAPTSPFFSPDLNPPRLSFSDAAQIVRNLKMNGAEISLKTSEQALANGQILAQQMGQLGIKINLQSLDWGTFYSEVKAGKFEMAAMRWVGIVDPDVYRDTLASREFPPGRNRGYYANATFDGLVEKARHEIDLEKRKAMYFKAEQIIAEDLPILPLWYNANISVLNSRVKNFKPVITGAFFPLVDAEIDDGGEHP